VEISRKKSALALGALSIIALISYRVASKPLQTLNEQLAQRNNIIPIAIIGSGPAGLNAALYGARSGQYTVVFEGKTPGGQLTSTTYVENWPGIEKQLGAKLIEQNREQAKKFGALMVPETIASVDFKRWPYRLTTDEGVELTALSVIIATGSTPRLLSDIKPVAGEKEYWGFGVTTCAVCDAPFYKGKEVVVVGGGDSAIEEATMLTSFASKVTLIVRGSSLRAADVMQKRLAEYPQIKVLYHSQISEIKGDGKIVTGVHIMNTLENRSYDLPTDGVFLAIGHIPNSGLFKRSLSVDSSGYIVLPSRTQKTTRQGIFAAGDVSDYRYRQAGVAAGHGIQAALDALEFLQDKGFTTTFAHMVSDRYYDPVPQGELKALDSIQSVSQFNALAHEHPWLIVEVGAASCSSCAVLAPVVKAVAQRLDGKAKFVYIDMDLDQQELTKKFNLTSMPSLLIFHKGALKARYDQQLFSKHELTKLLRSLIDKEGG